MRWLLRGVVVAAALWAAWWFVAATAVDRATTAAFDGIAAQGLVAARSEQSVWGFPNRLDLSVENPAISDPQTGTGYSAPFFKLYAMTWKPWHLIAGFAPEQRLSLPGVTIDIASERLQASLVLRPTTALPLDRLAIAGDGLGLVTVNADGDEVRIGVDTLRLGTRPDPSRANTHEVGLDLTGIAPGVAFLAALPPGHRHPDRFARLHAVAFAGFSAPLDRHAGQTRPHLIRLDLRKAALTWGELVFSATGAVTADAVGQAEGRIDIRLDDWQAALDAATAAGLIRPEIAPTWAEFARRLAQGTADPRRLDLSLTMARGRMALGPLPLGAAPFLMPPPGD